LAATLSGAIETSVLSAAFYRCAQLAKISLLLGG